LINSLSVIIGGGAMDSITNDGSLLTILFGDFGYLPISAMDTTGIVNAPILSAFPNIYSSYVDLSDSTGARDSIISIAPAHGRTVAIGGPGDDSIIIRSDNSSLGYDSYGDSLICGDFGSGKYS
jgi:hypothetical protein